MRTCEQNSSVDHAHWSDGRMQQAAICYRTRKGPNGSFPIRPLLGSTPRLDRSASWKGQDAIRATESSMKSKLLAVSRDRRATGPGETTAMP
jgi:hypothetical protein